MVKTNLIVQSPQRKNLLAQKRAARLIQSLFEQIERDITIAGNKDSITALKFYTNVNLMTSQRYQKQVHEIVDAIDGTLKTHMK